MSAYETVPAADIRPGDRIRIDGEVVCVADIIPCLASSTIGLVFDNEAEPGSLTFVIARLIERETDA